MPASEVLKQYFIDIKYRTVAAEGKQAQLTLHTLDVFAQSAQKSIDDLTKSLGGLVGGIKALGEANRRISGERRSADSEEKKQQKELREARQQEARERRVASDAEKVQRAQRSADTQRQREEQRRASTEARSWKEAELGQLREFRDFLKSQENEQRESNKKARELAQAKAKEDAVIASKEKAERLKQKKEQDEHNRLLAETHRRQTEVKTAFVSMAVAGVAAARAIWQSIREAGKEYAALTTSSNTYGASVRELIVLNKAIDLSGLDKLQGQFESFATTMQNVAGRKDIIADYSRQFTGMSTAAFKALSPMKQFLQTLEMMRATEKEYLRLGYAPEAARNEALTRGEQSGISREAGQQALGKDADKNLKDSLKSAEESTDKFIEATRKSLDTFNTHVIELNQTLKNAVDKQKGYAADYVDPWVKKFDEYLRKHEDLAAAAGIAGGLGSFALELIKDFGETGAILLAFYKLKKTLIATSALAGAEAGVGFGEAFNAGSSKELIKGVGKLRGILLGANLAALAYQMFNEKPEDREITPENAKKKQSGIWQGLGVSKETSESLSDPNWLQNTLKGWFGIKDQPAQTNSAPTTTGPGAPVSEETRQMLRERGSYQHGGIVRINAHEGEMVLPRNISEGLQRVANTGFNTDKLDSEEIIGTIDELNTMTRDYSQRILQWLSGSTSVVPVVKLAPDNKGAGAGGAGGASGQAGGGGASGQAGGGPGGGGPGGDGKGHATPELSGKGSGSELANQAISYFMKQGWSKEQAAGIASNIARESSWNTGAKGDGGKAFGLAQWHPDRQANFQKQFGKPIQQASFAEQLAFIDWELKNTEKKAGDQLRSSKTAGEAGAAVSRYYERPRDRDAEMSARGSAAEQLANQFREPAAFGMRERTQAGSGTSPNAAPATEVLQEASKVARTGGARAVKEFIRSKGYNVNNDWCGDFTNSIVASTGAKTPANPSLASNWLNWGQEVSPENVQAGDVAVKTQSRFGGPTTPGQRGGHVGVIGPGGYDPKTGQVYIQQGNVSGGQYREGWDKTGAWTFRRAIPTDAMLAAQSVAPQQQPVGQQAGVRQPFGAFPEAVPGFALGGLIPRMLQGILPAILHPGEMILPRGLSDGLQGMISAFGGRSQMNPLGVMGNMAGMFSRPLGGDFRNISYDQRADNSRSSNVNLTQVNNMNLGGFTGDSSGDLPRRMAAVHRRTAGDLVRNFQLAVR